MKLFRLRELINEWVRESVNEIQPESPTGMFAVNVAEMGEPDYSELAIDTNMMSNCCGAPPTGQIYKNHRTKAQSIGRCSKCQNGAIFSPISLKEMTTTGAVAGYQTPYAFSAKGNGSSRAIAASAGYKKVDNKKKNTTK